MQSPVHGYSVCGEFSEVWLEAKVDDSESGCGNLTIERLHINDSCWSWLEAVTMSHFHVKCSDSNDLGIFNPSLVMLLPGRPQCVGTRSVSGRITGFG